MIYTCTTNPSLDYFISVPDLIIGGDTRSDYEAYEAGGKGVNVSIVLNNFRIPNVALGFLGGFTKDYYLRQLSKYPNIQPLFTSIKDNTRINLKIMDQENETDINAKGPYISDDEFNKFKTRLSNIYAGDIFVLSGNIEEEIKDRMIELVHELSNDGIKVIIDSDKSFLDRCLDTKLFAVKLNKHNVEDRNNLVEYCKELINKNVEYVLYSASKDNSFLFSKDEAYTCDSLMGSLVEVTGTSDSMLAGFLYGVIRGAEPIESFKYANAASLATSMSNDLGSKEKIEELFDTIEVNKL